MYASISETYIMQIFRFPDINTSGPGGIFSLYSFFLPLNMHVSGINALSALQPHISVIVSPFPQNVTAATFCYPFWAITNSVLL